MSIWKVYAKKADFYGIGRKFNIDPVIARIIRNRNVIEEEEISLYLNDGENFLHILHSAEKLKDAQKAVSIIKKKIEQKASIRIIGDYDIDGICSIYILLTALQKIGAQVDYIIPDRIADGYGINESLIRKAFEDGIDTILTCDNGIAAIEQIDYAKNLGMTVIITDHHDVLTEENNGKTIESIPNADAVINPKQKGCFYPCSCLCGAGVALKLIQLLYREYGISEDELLELIEFAAIATVGDIVDLRDENRVIVKAGLKLLNSTKNIGLSALIDLCGLAEKPINAYHIGFVLGPCFNASGRLDSAMRVLQLLLEKDKAKAYQLAGDIKALNDERKDMTQKEYAHAVDIIEEEKLYRDTILVVYLPDCHESLAGIIAGRIREKYYRPSIVLTDGSENVKGSGRSIEAYNMFEGISRCRELLLKFGGHPMAAGMSLKAENIKRFRKQLNEEAELKEDDLIPVTWIDVPMPVDYITEKLINQISLLEPFGKGNEKPIFADKNLKIRSAFLIGKNKNVLKMKFVNERGFMIEGVMFHNIPSELPVIGDTKSIVYYPELNSFRGKTDLQLIVLEMS